MSRVLIIGSQSPVSRAIGEALNSVSMPVVYCAGHVDALRRLRAQSFGVVITSAYNAIDEGLAFLEEVRSVRPGVKCIVLAHKSTPDEVIAALRARVFAFFSPPFDTHQIASLASRAASESQFRDDIEIISARPGWVSVRVNSRLLTAERLMSFAKELTSQLDDGARQEVMQALREILLNAMEHGAAFNPEQVVEVTAIRTARTMVFRVRDPGAGFRRESITHAASPDPNSDPTAHVAKRKELGIRPGGYGLLLAAGTVDELIYNELGNEVLLIKYLKDENNDETKDETKDEKEK
jgi:DNA-binding NarL/FixJ family response regulator